MNLEDDPERVEAFRRGDRETLGQLYREYVPAVEKLLRLGFTFTSQGKTVRFRGFQEPFMLQESIQEGFLRAFREEARQAWNPEKPWRPYLLAIVRNQVIDQFRKQQVEQRYFVSLARIVGEDETEQEAMDKLIAGEEALASPEMKAFQSQLGEILGAFLDELDEGDRDTVRLHMLGEMTQQELADHLGESRNDVRKRIREIRSSLLRHLKREGVIGNLDAGELLRDLTVLAGVLL
mgnify:CR=1 FL=1